MKLFSLSGKNLLVLIVSIIFIAGGAVNNGFSWFLPAIPFFILLIYQLKYYSKIQATIILLLVAAICLPLGWDHPNNKFLYPNLGAKATFVAGWGYQQFSDSPYFSLVAPNNTASAKKDAETQPEFYKSKLIVFDKPITMRLIRVNARHPEFSTELSPLFEDNIGRLFEISNEEYYPSSLIRGLNNKTIESNDLQGINNVQSLWTVLLGDLMAWPALPIMIFALPSVIAGFISKEHLTFFFN